MPQLELEREFPGGCEQGEEPVEISHCTTHQLGLFCMWFSLPQLELERESREAVSKEKGLVERALAAEQQLVDAVKKEAAATDEALQASSR